MKFEIKADIPEGYEPTGEYRQAKTGEPWIDGGRVCGVPTNYAVIILREKWKWPAWLKADYIELAAFEWCARDGNGYIIWLSPELVDFVRPSGDHKIGDRIFNPDRREP
jgi:hypothetical protein